jgi:hypothetical protein
MKKPKKNFTLNFKLSPCSECCIGVDKAVQSLPVEVVEEARQETVRVIKSSSRPRGNLTKVERKHCGP